METNVEANLQSMALVSAAIKSSRCGAPVRVQEELETALTAAAQADFAAGCDLPVITMDIDMVAIRNQRLKRTEPIFDISDEEINMFE